MIRLWSLLLFVVGFTFSVSVTVPLFPGDAEARPGGGSSFRSSSSRRSSSRSSSRSSGYSFSSSSSGSSGGNLPLPVVLIIFAVFVIIMINKSRQRSAGQILRSQPTAQNRARSTQSVEDGITALKQRDPYFSRVLFLDFVHSLYHKYYTHLGRPEAAQLTPYLAPAVLQDMQKGRFRQQTVSEIVIGRLNIERVSGGAQNDSLTVLIEANYTTTPVSGSASVRHIVKERWLFSRDKGVTSKEPEKMRTLSCPNCGGPADFTDSGECPYCHQLIRAGAMQWMLNTRSVVSAETFRAEGLTSYAEEQGTALPTVKHPQFTAQQQDFQEAHQLPSWDKYWGIFKPHVVERYFLDIYRAWSTQQWQSARHLQSDRLFETNRFWIDQYRQQGLVNKLESTAVQRVELAKIERDHYYEAITVRIFATCYDYVVDGDGNVVGGSNRKRRDFTEYWTFVRRSGVERPEQEFDDSVCPSCGAALDRMNMAAECGYCGAKVNTGDFGWVLFLITQDEVYRG